MREKVKTISTVAFVSAVILAISVAPLFYPEEIREEPIAVAQDPDLIPAYALAGDANGDEIVNIGDVAYLINYIFRDGEPPVFIGDLEYTAIMTRLDSLEEDLDIIKTLVGTIGLMDFNNGGWSYNPIYPINKE